MEEIKSIIADNLILDVAGICMEYIIFDIKKLKVGDLIDARDILNHFYPARIIGKSSLGLLIHYIGWSSRWDVVVNIESNSYDYYRIDTYGVKHSPTHVYPCIYEFNTQYYNNDHITKGSRFEYLSKELEIDIEKIDHYKSYNELIDAQIIK
jgi:hypothetical protein